MIMSDVRFDLKPVTKRPSRKYRTDIQNGSCTKITDYEKDSKIFLSDYEYQPALTDKLDNLNEKTFDQELLNEIILWKVNRYATFDKEILDQIDSVKDYKLGEFTPPKETKGLLMPLREPDSVNKRVFKGRKRSDGGTTT